jgi:hypothetical protein
VMGCEFFRGLVKHCVQPVCVRNDAVNVGIGEGEGQAGSGGRDSGGR